VIGGLNLELRNAGKYIQNLVNEEVNGFLISCFHPIPADFYGELRKTGTNPVATLDFRS